MVFISTGLFEALDHSTDNSNYLVKFLTVMNNVNGKRALNASFTRQAYAYRMYEHPSVYALPQFTLFTCMQHLISREINILPRTSFNQTSFNRTTCFQPDSRATKQKLSLLVPKGVG